MRIRTSVSLISMLCCASCIAAGPNTLEGDRAAIEQVRTDHVRAVNGTNADLLLEGMADDVVYLGPSLDPILGATALRTFIEPVYRQIRPNITMTPKDLQIMEDVAYEWGLIAGTAVMAPGTDPVALNAKYVFVYRRGVNGSWRIVYDIYNDNAPAASSVRQ